MYNRQKHSYRIRTGVRDSITKLICGLICFLLLVIFLYPLIYVTVASFYSNGQLSIDGYRILLDNKMVVKGLLNSILYSSVGTFFSTTLTILSAFSLSRREFRGGKMIEFVFFYIPFHVSGGIIATYIVVRSLGLINTMWSLILPFAIGYRNLRDLKKRFEKGLARELYKAALLDGCGPWKFLFKIAIPLLSSTISLVAFRYFVGYWGNYFYAQIFITDRDKYPLSLVLNELLIKNQASDVLSTANSAQGIYATQMAQYALIVISSLPILLVYIIIQRKLHETAEEGGV